MDLKSRLARLDRLSRRPESPQPSLVGIRQEDVEASLEVLGLVRNDTPEGPVWLTSHRDLLAGPGEPLPNLEEVFSRPGPHRPSAGEILFLDTETTGLAGGTGTIAFLTGVSWWDGKAFVTRQYFLPGPGNELAMLKDLARLAGGFAVVVTFNGASFDLPLLRTRARLNRLEDPLAALDVWDLLVPARRLWGNRLPDCRQQTLEREVCGLERGPGDIDGSFIPQTWFDFLATGQPGLLPSVLTHNHRDMVGMGRLFLEVATAAGLIDRSAVLPATTPWQEGWALGRICERRRDVARSLACLEIAARAAPREPRRGIGDSRFLADALRILKRGGDWPLVERLIIEGLEAGVDDPWLHREAAILYEHRLVDLGRALDHALKSGEVHRCTRLEGLLQGRGPDR